jgi:hypothetical protein
VIEPLVPPISLPKIKRLDIRGDQDMFDSFDLRASGALIFHGASVDEIPEVNISSFPDQIRELSLNCVEWSQKPIQSRHFPNLTYLRLGYMGMHGTLGEYVSLPNLKHLILEEVMFKKRENINSYKPPLFSDARFLQGTPALEAVYLNYQKIDEKFVEGLKSCTLLKSLTLEQCDLSRFVPPFLECLQSSEFVPFLGALNMIEHRIPNPDMTFEEFRRLFMARRPNVALSNGPYVE